MINLMYPFLIKYVIDGLVQFVGPLTQFFHIPICLLVLKSFSPAFRSWLAWTACSLQMSSVDASFPKTYLRHASFISIAYSILIFSLGYLCFILLQRVLVIATPNASKWSYSSLLLGIL